MSGKLSGIHFKVPLFCSTGEKVLKSIKARGNICPVLSIRLSPMDQRTMIHGNVFVTTFQTCCHSFYSWNIVGTTFQCIVVLQSREKRPYNCWNFMQPGYQNVTQIRPHKIGKIVRKCVYISNCLGLFVINKRDTIALICLQTLQCIGYQAKPM